MMNGPSRQSDALAAKNKPPVKLERVIGAGGMPCGQVVVSQRMQTDVSPKITDIERITDDLVRRIGRHRFELWFGDVNQLTLEDRRLVVTAGNAFSLNRIRAQFDDDLQRTCREFNSLVASVLYRQGIAETGVDSITATPEIKGDSSGSRKSEPAATQSRSDSKNGSTTPWESVPNGTTATLGKDDFEFGTTNSLVKTAAQQVLSQPGQISPFVISGSVGSGKSHLLTSLCRQFKNAFPGRRGVYVSAEQFTSDFVEALKGRGLPVFRMKYREVDLLAIDDIQFFCNKRATLVELQNTVDHLLRQRKQIVLASDKLPSEMAFLGPELANRMSSGMVCRLNYPCLTARMNILARWCQQRSVPLEPTIARRIAQQLDDDVRHLLGAINRLHAAHLSGMDIGSVEAVDSLLADVFAARQKSISLESIQSVVSDVCGVPVGDLKSSKRTQNLNAARNLAMWLARKHTGRAYSDIGMHFGGRSHSTVISASKKVAHWIDQGCRIRMASGSTCPAQDALDRIESRLRCG